MKTIVRTLKGWKTVGINMLVIVVTVGGIVEWRDVIPSEYWPVFALVVALANIILRMVTTGPVGTKQ